MRQDQGRRDRRVRGAITIALLALFSFIPMAAAQAARPDPTYSAGPIPARVGQPVTFAADVPGLGEATLTWDFGDGTTITGGADVRQVTHAYESIGSRTVTLTVTRADEAPQVVSGTFDVLGPQAAFTHSPTTPNAGDAVAFDAGASSDPQGGFSGYAWDFGDGSSGSGATTTHEYGSPGVYTVTLTTTSALDGRTATARQTLRVNAVPAAGFGVAPASPRTGDVVTLTSTASDPDGGGDIAAVTWDLDDDGAFDDAQGATAEVVFLTAGDYTVGQRVTDANGAFATAFRTVAVRGAPAPVPPLPPDPTPNEPPSADDPPVVVPAPGEPALPASTVAGASGTTSTTSPPTTPSAGAGSTAGVRRLRALASVRVRIAGTVTADLTKLTSFSVVGPKGTTFRVRCKGRGCPAKPMRVRLARTGGKRLRSLHRTYRAGTRLTVDATKAGYLPKRVVLTFRRGAPPARKEQCLWPGARKGTTRAAACPTG